MANREDATERGLASCQPTRGPQTRRDHEPRLPVGRGTKRVNGASTVRRTHLSSALREARNRAPQRRKFAELPHVEASTRLGLRLAAGSGWTNTGLNVSVRYRSTEYRPLVDSPAKGSPLFQTWTPGNNRLGQRRARRPTATRYEQGC